MILQPNKKKELQTALINALQEARDLEVKKYKITNEGRASAYRYLVKMERIRKEFQKPEEKIDEYFGVGVEVWRHFGPLGKKALYNYLVQVNQIKEKDQLPPDAIDEYFGVVDNLLTPEEMDKFFEVKPAREVGLGKSK